MSILSPGTNSELELGDRLRVTLLEEGGTETDFAELRLPMTARAEAANCQGFRCIVAVRLELSESAARARRSTTATLDRRDTVNQSDESDI